jgi:hypothetical protein
MKKSHKPKTKASHPKKEVDIPLADTPVADVPPDEVSLAEDQFAVTGREEEASSSGHRVEPIIDDEEGNAEKLIEEGLHGYMHRSKKAR